jgi:mono/diheme cytochrome c family protein
VNKILATSALLSTLALTLGITAALAGGDSGAGEVVFEEKCGECHYEDDFSGKSEADILAMVQSVVSGETEHEEGPPEINDAEMVNVSAYFASF